MSVAVVLVVAVDAIVAAFTVENDTLSVIGIGGNIDEKRVAGSSVDGGWTTLMTHYLLG